MFTVTAGQGMGDQLPPRLWLAVSLLGVHLMEFKGQVGDLQNDQINELYTF